MLFGMFFVITDTEKAAVALVEFSEALSCNGYSAFSERIADFSFDLRKASGIFEKISIWRQINSFSRGTTGSLTDVYGRGTTAEERRRNHAALDSALKAFSFYFVL